MGDNDKVVEQYSRTDDIDVSHYVAKLKEHELRRASTNERQAYWASQNK